MSLKPNDKAALLQQAQMVLVNAGNIGTLCTKKKKGVKLDDEIALMQTEMLATINLALGGILLFLVLDADTSSIMVVGENRIN